MVMKTLNSSTQEADAGGSLNSRTVWSTDWVLGWPGLNQETLSLKTKQARNYRSFYFSLYSLNKIINNHLILSCSSILALLADKAYFRQHNIIMKTSHKNTGIQKNKVKRYPGAKEMTQWVKMSAAEIWLSNTMSAHLKAMRMMRARTLIFSGHLTAQYPSLGPCFNEGVILTFKFDYEPNFSFFFFCHYWGLNLRPQSC